MTALPSTTDPTVERSVQRYRRLLWLYPTSFREEYGDDLIQTYRDLLLFSADGRSVWWRTTRDLIGSVTRERAALFSPKRRPSWWIAVAGVLAFAFVVLVIGGTQLLLVPAAVLVALPLLGLSRFWHAWTIRRATGGPIIRDILLGLACIAPAAVFLAVLGEEAGYWVFIAVSGTLIASAAAGILWAAIALIRRPPPETQRPWLRATLVVIPSLAVLGFIIGASVNSYLRTIGPAGDHTVENASADTRELWVAAGDGDLEETVRITSSTCADPWVRYTADRHRNHENARGHAILKGHPEIERHLDNYMDDWFQRCGQPD